MQYEKKLELASRATTLWTRLMPSCPVPEQRYLIQWREQGKYALLTSITKTADKWDRNEFESPLAAWCYCASRKGPIIGRWYTFTDRKRRRPVFCEQPVVAELLRRCFQGRVKP